MKFFLQLEHWQLFLITFGLPNLFSIMNFPKGNAVSFIGSSLMFLGLFGWIWSIANKLYSKIAEKEQFKLWRFRILFFLALSILILVFWSTDKNSGMKSLIPYILCLTPFYLAAMAYIILFAAKTLKTVETGRLPEFKEYLTEALLIWMFPIGIWILQPRLNKLIDV